MTSAKLNLALDRCAAARRWPVGADRHPVRRGRNNRCGRHSRALCRRHGACNRRALEQSTGSDRAHRAYRPSLDTGGMKTAWSTCSHLSPNVTGTPWGAHRLRDFASELPRSRRIPCAAPRPRAWLRLDGCRLWKLLRSLKPDLVHNPQPGGAGGAVRRRPPQPRHVPRRAWRDVFDLYGQNWKYNSCAAPPTLLFELHCREPGP